MPAVQVLPVPGICELGSHEIELYRFRGSLVSDTGLHVPWLKTLICGDFLSPVEQPQVQAGQETKYLETLEQIERLLPELEYVIPARGLPMSSKVAESVLASHRNSIELR